MDKRIFLQSLSASMVAGMSMSAAPVWAQTSPKARASNAPKRSVFGLITPRNAEATSSA
jgi:hypothetical protein